MSWWSDNANLGAGNTLGQSIKNVFTPNNDTEYVGGTLKTIPNNANRVAAESMMSVGVTSLSGNNSPDPYASAAVPDSNDNPGGGGGGGVQTSGVAAPLTTQQSAALDPDAIIALSAKAGIPLSNADIEEMIKNPKAFLDARGMTMADLVPTLDDGTDGTTLDGDDYSATGEVGYTSVDAKVVDDIETLETPDGEGYTAETVKITDKETVDPITGEVKKEAILDPNDVLIDTTGASTGVNKDGTRSVLGEALNDFASQDISKVIDTSTIAGKLLAEKLGEGNYTDSKTTVLGQMKLISAEFKNPSTGEAIIPPWAQSLAREAGKSIAFGGLSASAATEVMSNALMEATLGVAEKDATFFQTVNLKNIDNRQQAIINKANVLSKLEMANLEVNSQFAVENAKRFMEMDLKNMDNAQQAEVINKEAAIQALFDNTNAINAERLYTATTKNDMTKLYAELNTQIARTNLSEKNTRERFDAGEKNVALQFSQEAENSRSRFYTEMQYNVDVANVKWRQTVHTENTKMMYEAVAADVKNMLNMTQEGQNQLWDRIDSLFDNIWKSSESELTREANIIAAEIQAQAQASSGSGDNGMWGAIGSIGAAMIMSDSRLKENITFYDAHSAGVNFYTWNWSDKARELGLANAPGFGMIAQEVQKVYPEAVYEGSNGYLMVNYGKIQ